MADELVEIYRGVHTLSELTAGGINIISGNSTDSYVIKDLQLNFLQSDQFPLAVSVDGFRVGAFTRSAEGSEIIQANADVTLSLSEGKYVDRVFHGITSTGSHIAEIRLAYIEGFGYLSDPVVERQDIPFGHSPGSSKRYAVMSEDEQYVTVGSWDGNSASHIEKVRVSDGQTVVSNPMTSYDACPQYGGDGYFYFTRNNNSIWRLPVDGAAGPTQFVSGTANGSPGTTYPVFGTNNVPAPNGERCFVQAHGNTSTVYAYFVNAETGEILRSYSVGSGNNQPFDSIATGWKLAPFFDLNTGAWKLAHQRQDVHTQMRVLDMPESSGNSSIEYSGGLAQGGSSPRFVALNDSIVAFSSSTPNTLFMYDTGMDDETVLNLSGVVASIDANEQLSFVRELTPTQAVIDGRTYANPSVAVRVTGVKSN